MRPSRICRSFVVAIATAGIVGANLLQPVAAQATDFPTRPVKLVVPYPVGGFSDAVARLLAPALSEAWGQSVVIDNRGGANGVIGTTVVAQAPADGHTLLVAIDSHVSNHNLKKGLPYDTVRGFAPVALLGSAPMVLIANPAYPASTVAELVAAVKAKPDSVSYGSLGAGSQIHLTARMLETSAGIKMTAIQYKGGGPAFTDLMAGHIQIMFASATSATPLVQSGRVKALGVASSKRLPTLANVPTMSEQGQPSVMMGVWLGFMAPAGTPDAIVKKVHDTLVATIARPDVAKRLTDMGFQLNVMGPTGFEEFIGAEITRWGEMLRRENIQPTD